MKRAGKLIILEGHLSIAEDMPESSSVAVLITNANTKAGCRQASSNKNKLFCYQVLQHMREHDVILVTPSLEKLDKRLRRPDVLIRLD